MELKKNILIICFAIISLNGYSQWLPQSIPNVTCLYFCNANIGYAGSWAYTKGNIYKTVDGGDHWNLVFTDTSTWAFSGIYFTSVDTGYAIGYTSDILKTVNGGITWTKVFVNANKYFTSIDCPHKDTCFVTTGSGTGGMIYKTVNGGQTWQPFNTPETYSGYVDFINSMIGYIVDDKTIKTTNGGLTWSVLNNYSSWDLKFLNESIGYTLGNNRIYKTTDSGNTWSTYPIYPTPEIGNESAIAFSVVNENVIFVACTTAVGLKVYKTLDGCNTWEMQYQSQDTLGEQDIFCIDENTGWVSGISVNHGVFKTTNGGETNSVYMPNNKNIKLYPNPTNSFVNMEFYDACLIEIFDIKGEKLYYSNNPNIKYSLNLSNYRSGFYYVKIKNQKQVIIKKIIKI